MANCVSVMIKMLPLSTSSSLAMGGDPGKCHDVRANSRKPFLIGLIIDIK